MLTEEPVPPSQLVPKLPRDLNTIVLKCLQKETGKRVRVGDGRGRRLEALPEGGADLARPVGRVERAARWCRRNPVVAGLIGLVMAVTAVGAGVGYSQYREAVAAEKRAEDKAGELATALGDVKAASDALKIKSDALEASLDDTRIHLSNAKVLIARQAWEKGNAVLASELLRQVPTAERRWEWHYLMRQREGGRFTLYGQRSASCRLRFRRTAPAS